MFINILKEYCHECYACVRNCPVSAVKVNDGKVEVIEERCIHCGKCVNLCSQNAREIVDQKNEVIELLQKEDNLAVALAPSYPVYKLSWQKEDWFNFLSKLGFKNIYEVAWGADLISEKYTEILQNNDKTLISSACPVIVNLINKYYPQLSANIIEVVSPMKALSRYIKKEGPSAKLVLVGPCQAKKVELESEENIAAVLTFSELFSIAEELDIRVENNIEPELESSADKNDISNSARSLAVGGELLKKVSAQLDNSLHIEGEKEVIELMEALKAEKIELEFADLLFCKGCIDGVDLSSENYFLKQKHLYQYLKTNSYFNQYNKDIAAHLDLSAKYQAENMVLKTPSEKEIWQILNKTDKYEEADLLDCGACGFESCRDKAAAVIHGFADVKICLPYLLKEKRGELKEIQKVNKNLNLIISSSYDGIMLIDKDGRVEKINSSYLQMLGLELEEAKGKKISQLEKRLGLYPGLDLQSLKEKEQITFVQNHGKNKRILLTAKAIKDQAAKLEQIIINARDLAEISFSNSQNELNDQDIPDYLVSKSKEMKKIINLAAKVAETDSTILITGESGTGKEVIAKFIYEQSNNEGDFVKINCAAIPTNLLESELFGYEKGAFSGARKSGKPGLIEEADNGTLFLDEIGELSPNMQAKLLQVLQEHSVYRIGSVKPKKVNFRLITATNRDLEQMVKDKEFREDLYYRLNVFPIRIPPLRKRKNAIPALIDHYLSILKEKYDKNISISERAVKLFMKYDWPGNVRELNNVIERLVITSEKLLIDYQDVLALYGEEFKTEGISVSSLMPLPKAVAEVEKKILEMAQENCKSTYEMADMLGVNQSTVVRKLKKYFH
ncbi:sigma 54-interacting transcriptional regulator [Halanaerobium sp. Z-7514]|uniref:HTH-type transcriptional regulatory protein TyrR n=1 Tax=Halanaerobium polyolivorans TaxID=2886943 RepID=A0AAW4X195_9FIRM|nr:sigma 54-interacting transcriptional regulator [Halanaerobium polyolivorans]MCC3145579.1 sigma 54-interacting transcriptional regulator [Halanaerobium polyolivorans]